MIRVIIIEDEKPAVEHLQKLIGEVSPEITIIKICYLH